MAKFKGKPLTKVVIRKLPPTMTEEVFLKQTDPLPEHESFYFVPADWSLGYDSTSRAYINFVNQDDVFLFKDRFDGYVFVDNKGSEYPAIVEFAPFQGLLRTKAKKNDSKCNTIETDPYYTNFIEKRENDLNEASNKSDFKLDYSFQIKSEKKVTSTPLLEYLANRRQERKDERKKKIEEKRKQRDDERQKRRNQLTKSIPPAIKEEDVNTNINRKERSFEKNSRDKFENLKKDPRAKRRLEREQRRQEERERRDHDRERGRDRDRNSSRSFEIKGDKSQNKEIKEIKVLFKPEEVKSNDSIKKLDESKEQENKTEQENIKKHQKTDEITEESTEINSLTSQPKSPLNAKEDTKEINESVRAFIMTVAEKTLEKMKTFNIEDIEEDKKDLIKEPKTDDGDSIAKTISQSLTIRKDDQTTHDKSKSIFEEIRQKERLAKRIRNKDRPSIEIYQPGKMRLSSRRDQGDSTSNISKKNNNSSRASSETKDYRSDSRSNPTSDCDTLIKDEKPLVVKKKVSRYSERRSVRIRDKENEIKSNDDNKINEYSEAEKFKDKSYLEFEIKLKEKEEKDVSLHEESQDDKIEYMDKTEKTKLNEPQKEIEEFQKTSSIENLLKEANFSNYYLLVKDSENILPVNEINKENSETITSTLSVKHPENILCQELNFEKLNLNKEADCLTVTEGLKSLEESAHNPSNKGLKETLFNKEFQKKETEVGDREKDKHGEENVEKSFEDVEELKVNLNIEKPKLEKSEDLEDTCFELEESINEKEKQ